MELKIQDIAKALGTLSASLTEATGSDMGILILLKGKQVGVFLGGPEEKCDADMTVRRLRGISKHFNVLAESIAKGESKTDGTCYAMDEDGKVIPLDKAFRKKGSEPGMDVLS